MSFLHDLTDPGANWCPDCGQPRGVCQCDTKELFPMLHARGAVPTVIMADRDGRVIGEVMKGSIAHRVFLANKYVEVKGE